MPNKILTPSKRLRITVLFLILNFATFWVAMYKGHNDLVSMATALALLNAPLYGYLFAETYRSSPKEIIIDDKINK